MADRVGQSRGGRTGEELPLLAVVYGAPSFTIFSLADAARDRCRLAFVLDGDAALGRALRRLGPVVDITGVDDAEALGAIRALSPDGILTFSDDHLPRTSTLAQGLELPFLTPSASALLTDKVEQRRALSAAGLPAPRFVAVPVDVDDALTGLDDFVFPVVVKPSVSAASRHTTMAADPREVRRAVAEARAGGERDLVVEEYLRDDPVFASRAIASFVSVETVAGNGVVRHLAVTGKFPLAPPFRETGHFTPSDLDADTLDAVLDSTTRALTALDVTTGPVHTEIKLTPDGPRVIEVNGRVGGAVPDVLVAAGGPSLVREAMGAALGNVTEGGLARCERVGYRVNLQPPTWARRVQSIRGIDDLPGPPGIGSVEMVRSPGEEVDWRKGTDELVVAVVGATDTLDDAQKLRRQIEETVVITYE